MSGSLFLSDPSDAIRIPGPPGFGAPEEVHVFAAEEIAAVNAALAARRALLVRGEPGIGKTQLARAAAVALGRAFVGITVDARTESRDLLWHFDAVARLAEAQRQGAGGANRNRSTARTEAALAINRFVEPRVLWWGLDWRGAAAQARRAGVPEPPSLAEACHPDNGIVVLIDEIDKADSDVPNGLLEALGAGMFPVPGYRQPVRATTAVQPLVVVTTNAERVIPEAFVRRCLTLDLVLPSETPALIARLLERGRAHFPGASDDLLRHAAEMVARDRETAMDKGWRPRPGQAEFMDLLRAALTLAPAQGTTPEALLATLRPYMLLKSGPGSG
jgi:MoxR-like ATPase